MKLNKLFISIIATGLLMSCTTNSGFPNNPTEGQRVTNSDGSSSVWNAALGCWMISSMMNGRQVQHHYYPTSGAYTTPNGTPATRPSFVPSSPVSTSSSAKSGVSTKSSTSSPAKSAGFGSSGRSSSSAS